MNAYMACCCGPTDPGVGCSGENCPDSFMSGVFVCGRISLTEQCSRTASFGADYSPCCDQTQGNQIIENEYEAQWDGHATIEFKALIIKTNTNGVDGGSVSLGPLCKVSFRGTASQKSQKKEKKESYNDVCNGDTLWQLLSEEETAEATAGGGQEDETRINSFSLVLKRSPKSCGFGTFEQCMPFEVGECLDRLIINFSGDILAGNAEYNSRSVFFRPSDGIDEDISVNGSYSAVMTLDFSAEAASQALEENGACGWSEQPAFDKFHLSSEACAPTGLCDCLDPTLPPCTVGNPFPSERPGYGWIPMFDVGISSDPSQPDFRFPFPLETYVNACFPFGGADTENWSEGYQADCQGGSPCNTGSGKPGEIVYVNQESDARVLKNLYISKWVYLSPSEMPDTSNSDWWEDERFFC